MSTVASFAVPRSITRTVSRLRLLVRLYVIVEGLSAVVIAIGLAFWLGLAVDWLWEPSSVVRVVMWFMAFAASAFVGWRMVGQRLFAQLSDDSLALLVERQHPQLAQGMVTSLAADAGEAAPFQRQFLAATRSRTAQAMGEVRLRRIFDVKPLVVKSLAACGLIGSLAALAAARPATFDAWLSRMKLSAEPWPRSVVLSAPDFPPGEGERIVNVARDDDYDLRIFASLADGHLAPDEVEVRWRRLSDDGRGFGSMTRIGVATTGPDAAQEYRYRFKASGDVALDVRGGDGRIRNLHLHAVERPAVIRMAIECRFPMYLHREPQTIPASGVAEVPVGTSVVCRMEANKSLAQVEVRDSQTASTLPALLAEQAPKSFSVVLGTIQQSRILSVTMQDRDGVSNREPFRLSLSAIEDLVPEAAVRLQGIGSAVTPGARIPFSGAISDDHALQEAWFEYAVDETAPAQRPLRTQPVGLSSAPLTEVFDLAEVDPTTQRPIVAAKPGQKLALSVHARDAYDLQPTSHVGSSQRFVLDVVTPSQLRALLEKRELALRQRFESIQEKMTGVSELLDRVSLDVQAPVGAAMDDNAARQRQRDRSRIAGAEQSAAQLAYETTGVAAGFDDIVAELVNNRVDTEELKQRLETGISEPLTIVGAELLPRFEKRLAKLSAEFDAQPAAAQKILTECRTEAKEILAAMQAVLDRMLELESYNELVDLLRGIIGEQQQLEDRTKAQQREKLRGLLEE